MTFVRFCSCVATLAIFAGASLAQNPTPGQPAGSPPANAAPSGATATNRSMRAFRTTGSISIDGKLDEAAWSAAVPSSDFTQSYPKAVATS